MGSYLCPKWIWGNLWFSAEKLQCQDEKSRDSPQASQETRHLSCVGSPEMTPKLAGINFPNFLSVASFYIICQKPTGGLFICFPTGPRHVLSSSGHTFTLFYFGVFFCQLDFKVYSAASGELKMFVLSGIFHCDPMKKVAKVWDPNPTPQHSLQVPISTSGTNSLLHPATGSRLALGSLCSPHWPWWNPFVFPRDQAMVTPVTKPNYSIKINLMSPLGLLMSVIIWTAPRDQGYEPYSSGKAVWPEEGRGK